MSLKDRINTDLKEAMKAKDEAGLRALRAIKSAILLAETAEGRQPDALMTEAEEMQLLTRQMKQRRDSIEQFEKNGRADLAKTEKEEVEVIQRYLPKALSAEELKKELTAIIAEVGATGAQDFGKVMKSASQKLQGKADGKEIAETVKALLNS